MFSRATDAYSMCHEVHALKKLQALVESAGAGALVFLAQRVSEQGTGIIKRELGIRSRVQQSDYIAAVAKKLSRIAGEVQEALNAKRQPEGRSEIAVESTRVVGGSTSRFSETLFSPEFRSDHIASGWTDPGDQDLHLRSHPDGSPRRDYKRFIRSE
jgi:hypothetical protein